MHWFSFWSSSEYLITVINIRVYFIFNLSEIKFIIAKGERDGEAYVNVF